MVDYSFIETKLLSTITSNLFKDNPSKMIFVTKFALQSLVLLNLS